MKNIIHKSNTRGHANYGWLDTHYTFSFANYYDPNKMQFGALRVLNDDYIAGGGGFDRHPHDNMEIVTIPTVGELEHKDSMGNTSVIKANEVQIMSAGTGIFHAEWNKLINDPLKLFQIWVLPDKKNVKPRYNQMKFNPEERINRWQIMVSPHNSEGLWLHQDAWFSRVTLEKGRSINYDFHNDDNGVYIFLIEGSVIIGDLLLEKRDGAGIWDTNLISLKSKELSDVLVIEIPMIS